MSHRLLMLLLLAATGAALGLAGCGGSDDSTADQSTATDSVTADLTGPSDSGNPQDADAVTGEIQSPDTAVDAQADVSLKPSWLDNPQGVLPDKLSDVGLFPQMTQRTVVHPSLFHYEPAYPLWTDGATKSRYLWLPAGTTIDNSTNAWGYPNGTIFFKHFEFPGNPVETRVIRKSDTGEWTFSTYQWNAAGTEATLLSGDQRVAPSNPITSAPNYMIPSLGDCVACHNTNKQEVTDGNTTEQISVSIIGFDELRLNSKLSGQTGTQLKQLEARGWFSKPVPSSPQTLGSPIDSPETKAVKAYLHGNCAHCHNGSNIANSSMDLRHDKLESSVINQLLTGFGTKVLNDQGIRRVVPKNPAKSAIYLFTTQWDPAAATLPANDVPQLVHDKPMPQLGVSVIDPALEPMLKAWINALTGP